MRLLCPDWFAAPPPPFSYGVLNGFLILVPSPVYNSQRGLKLIFEYELSTFLGLIISCPRYSCYSLAVQQLQTHMSVGSWLL